MPDMMFQALDPTGLGETAEQVRAMVQAAKSEIEAELDELSYAQPDGIYPDMTVGAVIGADETAQWAERESTGTGSATVRCVQGAAVAWGQLVKIANRTATSKGITYTAQDGKATFSAPNGAEGQETFYTDTNNRYTPIAGHKYIAYGTSPDGKVRLSHENMGVLPYNQVFTTAATTSGQINFSVLSTFTGTYECYPQLFDLTAMFGAGNEPTTVAEFEAMFPAAYYPYSAPTLKPVQIAGIQSTDADGDALDAVEWGEYELWGITTASLAEIRDELTANALNRRIGTIDLGECNYTVFSGGGEHAFYTDDVPKAMGNTNISCVEYQVSSNYSSLQNMQVAGRNNQTRLYIRNDNCSTTAEMKSAAQGVLLAYELATPTTTPISPALPMTYRVQQGGTESVIVPEGEIGAAPILTIADPVNMSTELALIWAAIEALQASRGSTLANVRNDLEVASPDEVEAPTMDESQITERKSDN